MPERFQFLSTAQFERLSAKEKLAYLSDAMEQLELLKVPRQSRGWETLFSEPEQDEPSNSALKPLPPESK